MTGSADQGRRPARPPRGAAALLFVTMLAAYALTAGGSLSSTDAVITYDLTRSLVEQRSLALPYDRASDERNRGVDGRLYSRYGIGQSIYNVPFYLLGRTLERSLGSRSAKPGMIAKAAVAMGSVPAAAGCVTVAFLFAWRLCGDAGGAVFATMALAFGTLLWPYSKFGFNAPLAAASLLGSSYLLWVGTRLDDDRSLVAAGAWLGVAWLTRHELVLAALPALAWLVLESDAVPVLTRRLVRFMPGLITAGVLWGSYNFVRFGSPLDVGHSPVFGAMGWYGLLLSPGGSILLYSPIVLAGIAGLARLAAADRNIAILLGGQALVLFCFYASLDDWFGGRSYGPRYLVPLVPLLAVPLAPLYVETRGRPARTALVALFVVSTILQLPGVLVDYSKVVVEGVQSGALPVLRERLYTADASSIALNTEALLRALSGRPSDRAAGLDLWWLTACELRLVPCWMAVAAAATLGAVAVMLARRLQRRLRDS